MSEANFVEVTRLWVERVVVGWNLCPFARKELVEKTLRLQVSQATTEEQLLLDLSDELQLLQDDASTETTLLIHPYVLQNFLDYNQFLDLADQLLEQMGLEGVFQLASFHPDYQFEGTDGDDVENFTNRSPYPLLHVLREATVEKAVARHPDSHQIPRRNIELMRSLGLSKVREALSRCLIDGRNEANF